MSDMSEPQNQLDAATDTVDSSASESGIGKKKKKEKKKEKDRVKEEIPKLPGTTRGIETMFRSTYQVQMDLTGLADNKANMMISINGIIISIIIASVAPKLDSNPWLLIPTMIFLIGTLISIVFAILAARPRVATPGQKGQPPRKRNILFFGDFTRMNEDDFVLGMEGLMENRTEMYQAMTRNIYGLGSVLQKKFALLQVAYTSFMLALILGVFSFIAVFVWIDQNAI